VRRPPCVNAPVPRPSETSAGAGNRAGTALGGSNVRYEKVAQAMAAAQRAGLRRLVFIAEPAIGR
jgi:hypothetical protein